MDTFSKIKNCLEKNKNSVLREFLTDDILGKILKDAKDPLCKLLTDYIYIITLKRRAHNDNTIKVVYRLNHIVKKMIIEVNTPSMNGQEAKRITDEMTNFQNNLSPDESITHIMEVAPMGNNPKFSTIAENCISKISNIKFGKKQLKENEMNILAINFLNEDMWCVNYEHTAPIIAGGMNGFYSGNLWQALYAKQGDSVLEGYRGLRTIPKLKFDGMFQRKENRKISAVLFIFREKTVLMENPYAQKKLSPEILQLLFNLSDFDYALSCVRWPKPFYKKLFFDAFKQKINNERNLINSVVKSNVEPV